MDFIGQASVLRAGAGERGGIGVVVRGHLLLAFLDAILG